MALGDLYSRSFPVVQSSGTGKSRMVDELAKELPCLHMSLAVGDSK